MIFNGPAYRIFAMVIACLVLFTSIGLAINLHSCNGAIKYVGVYTSAPSCEGDLCKDDLTVKNSCELDCSFTTMPCCTNEHFYSCLDVNATIGVKFTAFTDFVVGGFIPKSLDSNKWFKMEQLADYKPDLIGPNSRVLHQVYLI